MDLTLESVTKYSHECTARIALFLHHALKTTVFHIAGCEPRIINFKLSYIIDIQVVYFILFKLINFIISLSFSKFLVAG